MEKNVRQSWIVWNVLSICKFCSAFFRKHVQKKIIIFTRFSPTLGCISSSKFDFKGFGDDVLCEGIRRVAAGGGQSLVG